MLAYEMACEQSREAKVWAAKLGAQKERSTSAPWLIKQYSQSKDYSKGWTWRAIG